MGSCDHQQKCVGSCDHQQKCVGSCDHQQKCVGSCDHQQKCVGSCDHQQKCEWGHVTVNRCVVMLSDSQSFAMIWSFSHQRGGKGDNVNVRFILLEAKVMYSASSIYLKTILCYAL